MDDKKIEERWESGSMGSNIMNKEEAEAYIIKCATPYGLVKECLDTFKQFCRSNRDRNEEVDFWKEANDALWEWDI